MTSIALILFKREKTVLYSEEIKEYKIEKLNALPRDHYFPAKPATHEPEQWNISRGILCVQASVSNKQINLVIMVVNTYII